MANSPEPSRWLGWAYRNADRLFDFAYTHAFWIFLVFGAFLLWTAVRAYHGDKRPTEIVLTREFVVLSTLFLLYVDVVHYLLRTDHQPPNDRFIYITVAPLGSDEIARELTSLVEREIARQLPIFTDAVIRQKAIREVSFDPQSVRRSARARGIHIVVFGRLTRLMNNEFALRVTISQVHPKDRKTMGDFSWDIEVLAHFKGLQKAARDVALKVVRTCHQSRALRTQMTISEYSFNRYGRVDRTTAISVGGNISQFIQIGNSDGRSPFIRAVAREDGGFDIQGLLYDSDGTNALLVRNLHADVRGEDFAHVETENELLVRDRYDRMIVRIRVYNDIQEFADDYVRARRTSKQINPQLPINADDTRQVLADLGNARQVVTIEGEMYDVQGRIAAVILPSLIHTFQYRPVMR